MVKLQKTTRRDGTDNYSLNIPKGVVEDAELKKGDDVDVTAESKGVLKVKKV